MTRILKKDLILKVAELEKDIDALVNEPNSERAIMVGVRFRLSRELEKAVMFGNATVSTKGLVPWIKECGEYKPSDKSINDFEDLCSYMHPKNKSI
jgi:hypothetical protein